MSRIFRRFSCAALLLVSASLLNLAGCRTSAPPPIKKTRTRKPRSAQRGQGRGTTGGALSNDGNLLLGNPSNAGGDPNNFLLARPQYTLSYNKSKGESNWVAWHVDGSNLGDTSRGSFAPDPALPSDWQVTPSDYKGSGFDRGHICPSGDRTNSPSDNDVTFYMSNMLPQAAQLNQHVWADLEDANRELVRAGNEIYQIAGGAGQAGTIANGLVVVPQQCWKIVVVLPAGQNDLSRINGRTQVIAVMMPNAKDPRLETAPWRDFITPVAKIEAATGLRFFTSLPANVRSALESK